MLRGSVSVEIAGLREYQSKISKKNRSVGLQGIERPFIKAFVQNEVLKTSTQEPSTAPNWDEELIFDVEVDKTEKLYLKLFSETPESEELIAEMFVTFGDIWSGKYSAKTSRSMTVKMGEVRPKIIFSVNWEPFDPDHNASSKSFNKKLSKILSIGKMSSKKSTRSTSDASAEASADVDSEITENVKDLMNITKETELTFENDVEDILTESDDENYDTPRSENDKSLDSPLNEPEISFSKGCDFIDYSLMKLSGPRPGLLRAEPYYNTAKFVYGTITGLPFISSISGVAENVFEGILSHTPLKPKKNCPEEDEKSVVRAVDGLDKKIEAALSEIDRFFDAKKDDALKGICDVKDFIKGTTHFAVTCTFGFVGGLFFHGEKKKDAVENKDSFPTNSVK
mmetsp:Transcript_2153/g.2856  ORF Transcript_2153/g.2856 Transcript_2153/m.2856 type:complete len:397 (-) Transcript_2153:31-1221(-)